MPQVGFSTYLSQVTRLLQQLPCGSTGLVHMAPTFHCRDCQRHISKHAVYQKHAGAPLGNGVVRPWMNGQHLGNAGNNSITKFIPLPRC